jgi:hypothetical protein
MSNELLGVVRVIKVVYVLPDIMRKFMLDFSKCELIRYVGRSVIIAESCL